MRSLRADGVSATASSVPIVERLVPDSVVRSVLVRLARLGDASRRLASAIVVLGDGAFGAPRRALAPHHDEAAEVADTLAQAYVLSPMRRCDSHTR